MESMKGIEGAKGELGVRLIPSLTLSIKGVGIRRAVWVL